MVPRLPAVNPDAAAHLHTSQHALKQIADLLQASQQIVLYGPPGTGKTYLAMALARQIVGPENGSRVQLAQFHPGKPYVLIIDELNRANLAKVFGELYYLLEYRDQWINLHYQPDKPFSLPLNLFIIGTMNTADRSIALLHAAMPRRFSFIELHPDEDGVRQVLGNWLNANSLDGERARLLAALNKAIEDQDRDLRIGPSYLMRRRPELRRVWRGCGSTTSFRCSRSTTTVG